MTTDDGRFKGTVQMSSFTGSGSGLMITVTDEKSGLRVLDVRLTREDAGSLLCGYQANCEYEVVQEPGFSRLGKRHEYATINVVGLTSKTWKQREQLIEHAMRAGGYHPDDGWVADRESMYNFHRAKGDGYEVWVRRWVEDK
jgi:hypothetical protein